MTVKAPIRAELGQFQVRSFEALDTRELYEILRARADVFVGEEKILYPDADGLDYGSLHVFAQGPGGEVTAYLRAFEKPDEPSTAQMGRVLTRVHGTGLGRELVEAGVQATVRFMGAKEVYVEAQSHAEGFYRKLGFVTTSGEFMEAGIPHVRMRLHAGR